MKMPEARASAAHNNGWRVETGTFASGTFRYCFTLASGLNVGGRRLSREPEHCFQMESLWKQIQHVRLLYPISGFQQAA